MGALDRYKQKRDFENTTEPAGEEGIVHQNRYVIQKHEARRTHYDFRMQVGDALLSWAIPKEPSYDPSVRRLAIRTEDHPVDYYEFEGVIPKNNYGAGTMMVWDQGTYEPNGIDKNDADAIRKKVDKGSIKLFLNGSKLKGHFSLYRIDAKEDKEQWMFVKSKDEYAGREDELEEHSVLTGRSMDEIRRGAEKMTAFPETKPMLATLGSDPFDNPAWIFEIKLDGYRILGTKNKDARNLISRNGKLYNENYKSIHKELSSIDHDFIIDGEVVVLEPSGRSDFGALQNLNKSSEARLFYYVFDLLWLDGYSLMDMPLINRKAILKSIIPEKTKRIKYLDHIEQQGKAFFEKAAKLNLEGLIAKRKESKYYPGKRTDEWIKLKAVKQQEVVIVGYTDPKASREYFGSLVMAVMDDGNLRYAGKVGTGFNEDSLKRIYEKLKALETEKAPIEKTDIKDVHWVKPELIAEVQFAEWTAAKSMRHPSFKGLRNDKPPRNVKKEKPQVQSKKLEAKAKLSNPDKVFWPEENYKKKDVYRYYEEMAEIILPYLKDRPQSLFRTPDGISGEGFFQKNVKGLVPDWIDTVEVESSSSEEDKTYMLCQNKETLLYMANLGCIEINPWNSSLPELDKPDYVVFDLDPVEIAFEKVVEVASAFRDLFEELKLPFYIKTSGSRGMHIYLPVLKKYSQEQAQQFVKLIEMYIHRRYKEITSFERSPSKRRGMIYLDYLQNARGRTMASVYSLRPKPGAKVSAPVAPDELNSKLNPDDFNINTMKDRINKMGDLWKGFFENRVDMTQVLQGLDKIKK